MKKIQNKEFRSTELQTLPPATGVDNIIIENDEQREQNYHGIRFKGRIIADDNVTNIYMKGYVTLMCIPNDNITIPAITSAALLEDAQSYIIASELWSMFSGPTQTQNRGASIYDFDFAPKTSRTCSRGGKIVGQVTNESVSVNAVYSGLLSSFGTAK